MRNIHPLVRQLAQARHNQGLTQGALADDMGITHAMISRWETGRVPPTFTSLTAWAAALGYDIALAERPGADKPAISDDEMNAVLAEAFPPPLNQRVLEDYRYCRDTGDTPEMAAHRTSINPHDRERYEIRYQRQKKAIP